ncbi:hypothetical protein B0T24DRAFT_202487 [Lasiosphaeria ovina]|uniref:C2H2-type domain-containing protein n=1 Tax=Lasiosphaeria ovina TaxID=92902 RepID=A0AAE0N9A4_9PEZI|nr:hypothetical protein B0T24DRAFT_202487 [Lasiosphaeria ovina]
MPEISVTVKSALSSFKYLITALNGTPDSASTASSHLARFKLWVGSLSAHRPLGSRSLEYRLRDASSLRNHVVSLLRDLCQLLGEAQDTLLEKESPQSEGQPSEVDDQIARYLVDDDESSTESELAQILGNIGGVVDCLLRLSLTISNPAPHDVFKSRVGAQALEHYEPWDIQHVQHKFSSLDPVIAKRLGLALTQRRKYFKYREEHSSRLRQGLESETEDVVMVDADGGERTTVASSLPDNLKEFNNPTGIENLATPELDDDQSEVSGTSYAPSTANTDELRVPRIPEEYIHGPFMCPFCYMIVSIDSRHAWKNHVFRDLRPYICLFPDCDLPHEQYARRKDWAKHMTEHWITWACPLGCTNAFDSVDEFQQHIRTSHPTDIGVDNIDALASLSSRPDLAKADGMCPLCLEVSLMNGRKYESHVGNHLEQLALFALPKALEDEDDEGDVVGSTATSLSGTSDIENTTAEQSEILWRGSVEITLAGRRTTYSELGRYLVMIRHASVVESTSSSPTIEQWIQKIPKRLTTVDQSLRESLIDEGTRLQTSRSVFIAELEPQSSTSRRRFEAKISNASRYGLLKIKGWAKTRGYLVPKLPGKRFPVPELIKNMAEFDHILNALETRPVLYAVFLQEDSPLPTIFQEGCPAYRLSWEILREWLLNRFPTHEFDSSPHIEYDYYIFNVPEPLTEV